MGSVLFGQLGHLFERLFYHVFLCELKRNYSNLLLETLPIINMYI